MARIKVFDTASQTWVYADKSFASSSDLSDAVRYGAQTLTPEQQAQARQNIDAVSSAELAEELAKREQLQPEYANSIEDCTDTSKMYVLPDGYIYAYTYTEVPAYTNVLTTAVDVDNTPYNGGLGYKEGYRYSTSSGEIENPGTDVTGYIPFTARDDGTLPTLRFKNITLNQAGPGTITPFENYGGSDKTLGVGTIYTNGSDYGSSRFDENGVYTLTDDDVTWANYISYIRITATNIDSNSIITIDEEITDETKLTYAWTNTGHAFVPADYEDTIVALQTDVDILKNKVNSLESDTGSTGTTVTDSVEILIPSEAVAVVGVEFNIYHKSIIRTSRSRDNYDVKIYLNNNSVSCRQYAECFRLTADADDVGDYTLTVEVRNLIDQQVIAYKSMMLHIIDNRTVSGKNVLFLGDSLTASRNGLYAAEIQHNLSGGGIVSIGTQNGSQDINQIGIVKHEGYNSVTCGGFLKQKVNSSATNPFYNPVSGTFDLEYFMTNNGYSKVDAVCLNLGHNNLGNEVAGVADLTTIIEKIHAYNADIPVIVSLITPVGNQDAWSGGSYTSVQMRYHWSRLIKAYIDAFDNEKISNVYLSTPYFNVDADNDLPTETVARCARDATQIVRQNDSVHPTRIGTLKMADSYYADLLYRMSNTGEDEPAVMNLVDPRTATSSPDTTTLFKDEWINGYYLSASTMGALNGCIVTNLFPVSYYDSIKVEGIALGTTEQQNRFRWYLFDANGNRIFDSYYGFIIANGVTNGYVADFDASKNTVTVDFSAALPETDRMKEIAYARFCCYPAGANEDLIVSVVE